MHIRKGDMVRVLTGESRGKDGRVLEVDRKTMSALVEGLNMKAKHSKPTTASPQGGITHKEGPIHLSNLMLLDPKSGEPTRVGRSEQDGKLVRTSKRTGEVIKS
ncbi:MAG: 50S ribosomal protein L24 [Flavobacteriales bacterium]|nr:50S ribosomal protein L24 [Flavobacteriales bacterium]